MVEILKIWFVLNCIVWMFILIFDGGCSIINPVVIYKHIKVNWFGAAFISLVCHILFPLVAVPYWIYKLFTVGRK